MMIRLRTGMTLEGCYCAKCDAKREARVFQERYRWMYRYKPCGHIAVKGYCLPPDELSRLGYVDKQREVDPRTISKIKQQEEDERRRRKEIATWNKMAQTMTTLKPYEDNSPRR